MLKELRTKKDKDTAEKFANLEVFFANLAILQIYFRANFNDLDKFISMIEVG